MKQPDTVASRSVPREGHFFCPPFGLTSATGLASAVGLARTSGAARPIALASAPGPAPAADDLYPAFDPTSAVSLSPSSSQDRHG